MTEHDPSPLEMVQSWMSLSVPDDLAAEPRTRLLAAAVSMDAGSAAGDMARVVTLLARGELASADAELDSDLRTLAAQGEVTSPAALAAAGDLHALAGASDGGRGAGVGVTATTGRASERGREESSLVLVRSYPRASASHPRSTCAWVCSVSLPAKSNRTSRSARVSASSARMSSSSPTL